MSAGGYAEFIFLQYVLGGKFDEMAGERWMPADQMESRFHDAMRLAFRDHGFIIDNRFHDIVDKHISRLFRASVLVKEGDEFTGEFINFGVQAKDKNIKAFIDGSEIGRRVTRLGDEALHRALETLADREGWERVGSDGASFPALEDLGHDFEVPAADRIVRLDHNQQQVTSNSITELLDALESDNGDPDQPGFRERLIGQARAGRELIRSGEFRAYLLYEVLVRALGEIIRRYKNPTVVALANALLGAIVSQILQTK